MLERDDKLTDEGGRVAALHRACILDTCREEGFDKITRLVRSVLRVPIAAVSLVDGRRQWFKSIEGLDSRETPRSVAFCAHTILQRSPLVVPDATLDPRFSANPLVTGEPGIRSYAGIPLRSGEGYNLGSLCAIDTVPRDFSESELDILANLASLVMDEIELRTMTQLDHLTGAMTRRTFFEQAAREVERFKRYRRPLSLMMFDLDHFKRLNDAHGHPFGDEVLAATAKAVTDVLRPTDLFGRYGGEEFAILLSETSLEQALQCAERVRASIASLKFSQPVQVTASFGITAADASTDSLPALIAEADAALYCAKRSGRNRCACAAELMNVA